MPLFCSRYRRARGVRRRRTSGVSEKLEERTENAIASSTRNDDET
jgi:hypothetical protein